MISRVSGICLSHDIFRCTDEGHIRGYERRHIEIEEFYFEKMEQDRCNPCNIDNPPRDHYASQLHLLNTKKQLHGEKPINAGKFKDRVQKDKRTKQVQEILRKKARNLKEKNAKKDIFTKLPRRNDLVAVVSKKKKCFPSTNSGAEVV
ncbi:hypothetical protein Avbf_12370 [Armadillidium vulgare]|nr:hypothetical protein Avbf_12370 [Armadillidium vulgare]